MFLSLFTGREDVFAKHFVSKTTGKPGYAPVCHNFWDFLCPKKAGEKMKCSECPNHNFVKFDANVIEKHLKGEMTVGVYPMLPDETCRFLAFDFDAEECDRNELLRDVSAIRKVCDEKQISMAVERSRSGKGIHFWIFFAEKVAASIARKFGSSLITYAMSKYHEVTFETYDRLIPTQDIMPMGGLGNLIALPLQKVPREQKNSEFIDANFNAYADQWNYLYNIKKYTLDEIEHLIRELAPLGELGVLRKDAEDEKPWESRKPTPQITLFDFPEIVEIVRSNMLYVKKDGISNTALNTLKRLAAFRNPEFYKKQAMRQSTHDIPRIISCSDENEQYLYLPRGLEDEVTHLIEETGAKVDKINELNEGRKIDVVFNGVLREEQQPAADALLAHDNGILAATTAFGKTVIGAHIIAQRKVNTLVILNKKTLLSQWIKQLGEFLIVNEEPIVEYTPTGRKKKKSVIGRIGGGTTNPGGIIDVALMQSLVSGDDVKDIVKDYGMVIVDECHRVAAFTFEKIVKATNARYVYGLTATPTRKEGHHPIIYMHCGKIRYRVDAKSQAEARPFEHYIIPRFTRFIKPAHRDDKWHISDVYSDIQNSEIRNNLIVQDVTAAVEQGRNPIILTERKEHVRILADRLRVCAKNVIALTGGLGEKESREILQSVADIPEDESFILIATGKYVGEGFDMPRLDTLFLAMPISWSGTIQQYAGRLHRLFDGKEEVQIYDYVDVHVTMLENMYQKRQRSYAAIGYKAKGAPHLIERIHSIFDNQNFFSVYSDDVLTAQKEVVIVSPFLTKRRVLSALNYLTAANSRVTVVTKPPDNYPEKDRAKISECIEMLTQHGIIVKNKDSIHQKFAIMDQRTIWYGSINLLSYGTSEESIMRIESVDIAGELLESLL